MPLRLLVLLPLAACVLPLGDKEDTAAEEPVVSDGAGSVVLTGAANPFGDVASAVWYREPSERGAVDRVVLTTVEGACPKIQAFHAAEAAFYATLDDPGEDWCAVAAEPALALAEATGALFPMGSHALSINLFNEGSSDTLWAPGTYDTEATPAAFYASVTYAGDHEIARFERWDVEGTYEDNCGVPSAPSSDLHALIQTATMAVTSATALDQTVGTFDGEAEHMADAPATIAATFDAVWCEVE